MNATGVIVRIRETGAEFGMHDVCADRLISALIDATGLSTLDDAFPAVIIGPLFADASEWTCAHNECNHA